MSLTHSFREMTDIKTNCTTLVGVCKHVETRCARTNLARPRQALEANTELQILKARSHPPPGDGGD